MMLSDLFTQRDEPIHAEGAIRRLQALLPHILHLQEEILTSGQFIQGPHVRQMESIFEQTFARSDPTIRAAGISSGTMALKIALLAAGAAAEFGEEIAVICPAISFASTAFAINQVGAIPVFVDVDPLTLLIDAEQVDQAMRSLDIPCAAVIPVHLYGNPCDMIELSGLGHKYGLSVIEDCAQAYGATLDGRQVGTWGHFGAFSLYYGKNIGGLADAGLLTWHEVPGSPLSERMYRLRDLGRSQERYSHTLLGERARMREIDAAVVTLELSLLPYWNERRQMIAMHYRNALHDLPLTIPDITPSSASTHAYYKFPLLTRTSIERDLLHAHLRASGIEGEIIYPSVLPDQEVYQQGHARSRSHGDLAVARDCVSRLLCLPIYPELRSSQIERIVATVRAFYP